MVLVCHRIGKRSSLDTLGTPVVTQANSGSLTISYTGSNGLEATVGYVLTGGATGSNTSDIGETITLQNTTGSPMPLHFYQYSNFQLGGGSVGNSLQFSNAETVDQTATVGNMAMTLSETAESVDVPFPSEWQGGAYPSLLNLLNSGGSVTLNDTPAIGDAPIGPGDMELGIPVGQNAGSRRRIDHQQGQGYQCNSNAGTGHFGPARRGWHCLPGWRPSATSPGDKLNSSLAIIPVRSCNMNSAWAMR